MSTHAISSSDDQTTAAEEEWLEQWTRGPVRTTWDALPPQVGDHAPSFSLAGLSGESVSLDHLLGSGPALLLFWRQYGCGCGVDRAARLRDEYEQYVGAGGSVVVIGQAEPQRSAVYAEHHAIPCPVLCDPELKVYRSYGLLEGHPAQVVYDAPPEFMSHDRDVGAEFQRQRREQGRPPVDSPWQLPGEFVIDSAGIIRLAYRYQYCEDFPNPLVLVSAIREAARGG